MKHLNTFFENTDIYFTKEEVDHLLRESDKIGFTPQPYFTRDKSFLPEKVKGEITFIHNKTKETISLEKWKIKNLGLDIMKDSITDILFIIIFSDIKDENYNRYYDASRDS